MKNLCILVRTIGPYHHARFNALCGEFKVYVFETRPRIGEYDWDNNVLDKAKYTLYKNYESNNKITNKLIVTYLDEIKPDFIITHGWADYEYLVALQFAKKNKIPVGTLSDSTLLDYKRNPIKELLKRNIANCFDSYLAAGTRSIEYLNCLGVYDNILTPCDVIDNDYFEHKTEAIRSGKEDFTIENLPQQYILCVCRFIPEKNISTFLEAYSEVMQNQLNYKYSIVLVGSGSLKSEVEQQIEKLKLESKVCIFSFAQYTQLPQFYARASALIIPSVSDTWGLVVNEAMACGLPVLVSKNCGCAVDLVKEGINGIVFEPQKEDIVKALLQFNILTDKTLAEFGYQGKKTIQDYSLNNFVKAIIEMSKVKHKRLNLMQRVFVAVVKKYT